MARLSHTISFFDTRTKKELLPPDVVTGSWYKRLARSLLYCVPEHAPIPLSIILVDAAEIKRLNATYRRIRRVTDVLSYGYTDDGETLREGEIYICPSQALRQRHRFKTTIHQEFARLFFHGALHIFGFDHMKSQERKEMRKQEQCLMDRIHL